VFLWTVPVAVLGFVVALFLKQVRLRDSARLGSTDMGEGFASPSSTDSRCVLETTVSRIVCGTEADTIRGIVAESGTRLAVAGAWAVVQVELATRVLGTADLEQLAARRRMPPEVLVPVFDRVVADGLLTATGYRYDLTRAGRHEVELIGASWAAWLAEQVERDLGHPPEVDLRAAVATIAKRLLTEDQSAPRPEPAGTRA
jgi:hypothetical protein